MYGQFDGAGTLAEIGSSQNLFRTIAGYENIVGNLFMYGGDGGAIRLDRGTYVISITILRRSGSGLPYTAFSVGTDVATTIITQEESFNAFNMTAVYTVQTEGRCYFSGYFVIATAISWNGRVTVAQYQ